jgi:hypothetical protein
MITLAELLMRDGNLPRTTLERKAVVHGHCHHKAVIGTDQDRALLGSLGLDYTVLDSGCCGMAGGFGFEEAHYDVSLAIGERVLLPAVRNAPRDTLIVADGFSCREQIAQCTGRRALHTAELVRMAMVEGPRGPAGDLPEQRIVVDHTNATLEPRELAGAALLLGAAALLLRAALVRRRRQRRIARTAR